MLIRYKRFCQVSGISRGTCLGAWSCLFRPAYRTSRYGRQLGEPIGQRGHLHHSNILFRRLLLSCSENSGGGLMVYLLSSRQPATSLLRHLLCAYVPYLDGLDDPWSP